LRAVIDEFLYSSSLFRIINSKLTDHSTVFNNPNKYNFITKGLRKPYKQEQIDYNLQQRIWGIYNM